MRSARRRRDILWLMQRVLFLLADLRHDVRHALRSMAKAPRFAASALLLSLLGVYGVAAQAVRQRIREIGIRMALGAQAAQIRLLVLRDAFRFTLAGIVVGMGSAFALADLISGFLFGVTARDPFVFFSVTLGLSLAALAAVWWPARRATRVDPILVLRAE